MPRTIELALMVAALGCASNEELAARLRGAMTPDRLASVAA